MAQISYRANLSSTVFPMTLDKAGRSVINPAADNNFDKRVDPTGTQTSAGIPQAVHMENVLPTPEGFKSVMVARQYQESEEAYYNSQIDLGEDVAITRVEQTRVALYREEAELTSEVDFTSTDVDFTGLATWADYAALGGSAVHLMPDCEFNPPSDATLFDLGTTGSGYEISGFTYERYYELFPELEVSGYMLRSVDHRNVDNGAANLYYFSEDLSSALTLAFSYKTAFHNDYQTGILPYEFELIWNEGEQAPVTYAETVCLLYAYEFGNPTPVAGKGIGLRFSTGSITMQSGVISGTNTLQIVVQGSGVDLDVILESAPFTVDQTTWYKIDVAMTRSPTNIYQFTVKLQSEDGLTDHLSLVYTGPLDIIPGAGTITWRNDNGIGASEYEVWTPVDPEPEVGVSYFRSPLFTQFVREFHIEATLPTKTFTTVGDVRDVYLAFSGGDTSTGTTYSLATSTAWQNYQVIVPEGFYSPTSDEDLVSWAFVQGVTYYACKKEGLIRIYTLLPTDTPNQLEFEDITDTIKAPFGSSYDFNRIQGIVGSFNYLILYAASDLFWSSTTTPTDFAVSLVSGAGSISIGNLRGDVKFAKEHATGFILYSTGNVISASYTGNARYPWKLVEVSGSSGYEYPQQVAGDTNSEAHIGLTSSKMIQATGPQESTIIAQELTTHLERDSKYTSYNYSTDVVSVVSGQLTSTLGIHKLWQVLDRYILVGYVQTATDPVEYQYAMIYDTLLRRYGKIKASFHQIVASADKVFFIRYGASGINNFLPLQWQSTVEETVPQAVLLLGKFQYQRDKFLTLDEVTLETVEDTTFPGTSTSLRVFPSLDGHSILAATVPFRGDDSHKYLTRTTCQNFLLALKGEFDVTCVAMKFHLEGNR